jgi:hypothetical protein
MYSGELGDSLNPVDVTSAEFSKSIKYKIFEWVALEFHGRKYVEKKVYITCESGVCHSHI